MGKIKVLFLIHNLMHGGAEKVLVNLVNNMNHDKFDVTIQTLFDVGVNKQFLSPKVNYKTVCRKLFRGNTKIQKRFSPEFLYRHMIKGSYDILVAYLEGSCTRIISGCPEKQPVKIAWRHFAENKKEFLRAYRSLEEAKQVYLKYDQVVGVSKTVIEAFEDLTKLTSVSIVKYNTNETEKIKELAQEEIDNPKFIQDGLFKICGVAKIRPNKGFMRLARVHKRLQEEGYKYRIYILGEGEEKEKIKKYLEQNDLSDTFVFLGYDTNPYKYVQKCDLFVCPSFEEGFNTAATESLIVGTPVVTTLCSGMKEMLGENNEYGLIEENSELGIYKGLKYMLDHPDKLQYYKEQAVIRGKTFSMQKTVDEVEEMFERLLNEKQMKSETIK